MAEPFSAVHQTRRAREQGMATGPALAKFRSFVVAPPFVLVLSVGGGAASNPAQVGTRLRNAWAAAESAPIRPRARQP